MAVRGDRTVSGVRVLPPRATFQEVAILPRGFVPRALWVRHGLGIDAELVVMRATRTRPVLVRTWRTFDDEGHITIGLELEGRPRPPILLLLWSSHCDQESVIDWELSTEAPPRPVPPVLDTALGEPLTSYEVAFGQAFGVAAGVVRQVADEVAGQTGADRSELLDWIDRCPWSDVERSYWVIRAEVDRKPQPAVSVARVALALWMTAAARAMQKQPRRS